MNVERLLILQAVAESGSVTATAADLMVSVSAVSQQLAKLEREVGLSLVERHPRGVSLTDAGQALASHAHSIDKQLSAARSDIAQFRDLKKGTISIATFPTFAASIMPTVIRKFHQRYPDIDVRIISSRLDGVIDALERREADVGLLWDYPWTPLESADLHMTTLLEEESMLVVPENHRFAGRASVAIDELSDEKWVTRNAHPVRDVLMNICQSAGFTPNVVMATSDYQELQGMVSAGVGIALSPRLAVMHSIPGLRVIPLSGNPAPRRVLLGWSKGKFLPPALEKAVQIFFEVVREMEWEDKSV